MYSSTDAPRVAYRRIGGNWIAYRDEPEIDDREAELRNALSRFGVAIDGRSILIKAAHCPKAWTTAEALAREFRYSLIPVAGAVALPLPQLPDTHYLEKGRFVPVSEQLPALTPRPERAGRRTSFYWERRAQP